MGMMVKKVRVCLFAALFALSAPFPLFALEPGGVWSADWIASPSGPQRDNAVYYFRKSIELTTLPSKLLVDVSADNKFVLYVNEARAGDGPATSDLNHWKYERIDLAPFLRRGKNVVAAVVWNFGVASPVYQSSARTGFLVRAEDPNQQTIDTNSTWEVEQDKGRHALVRDYIALLKNYYGAVPGEEMDGGKHDWNWNAPSDPPGQGNAAWEPALALGHARPWGASSASTPWVLQPDPLPPMERTTISPGKLRRSSGIDHIESGKFSFSVPANSKATVLLDTGAMTTGYPEITTSGGADASIHVTYAEALVDQQGNRENRNRIEGMHIVGISDKFLVDGGSRHTFSPLNWRAWRYMQLDITTGAQPLTIDGISASFSAFPFKRRAGFISNDPELNKIWRVGWRTARLDAHETYMDTPYWERLQYVADTRIQALISYAVAGNDELARQAIDAFDDSRLPGGLTQSRYPSRWQQVIPPFSLLWVDMLHDFWMYRDDPQFVRSHLEGARAVLDWFLQRQRSDGMLGKLPWWDFIDWAIGYRSGVPPQDQNGGSAPITLQMIGALHNAAAMETKLGDPARAMKYKEAAQRASDAVWKLCWNPSKGLLADAPSQSHFSQQTNILAIWLGVVPPGRRRELMSRVLSLVESGNGAGASQPVSQVSYYFRFYLARALESSGAGDQYISTLEPWRHMLALGLTTWAERLERPRSDSHAWSAHPTYDLLRIVAGIRPGAPGFSSIVISPHLGNLRFLRASQPTPRGMVDVSYQTEGHVTTAEIDIPAETPAKLIWNGKEYTLHGGTQKLQLQGELQ